MTGSNSDSATKRPLIVKWPLKRLGDGGAQWAAPAIPGYVFTHDPACAEYDWLVVYDEFPFGTGGTIVKGREKLACPRSHTILLTQEPVALKYYGRRYTHQFGHLLTTRPREAEKHPGYHLGRGYYISCRGESWQDTVRKVLPPKTKLISAVCSSKAMRHSRHWQRYALVKHLAETIHCMDWYGYGVKYIDHKYEALDSYKYHVAVENVVVPGHWTEKVSDALLSECLPFYAGDPALGTVLPPESFIPIPIDDPVEAERIVKAAIAAGEYEKRLPAIRAAKKLILEKYNTFSQIVSVIESVKEIPTSTNDRAEYVESRHRLRWHPDEAMRALAWHVAMLVRNVGQSKYQGGLK